MKAITLSLVMIIFLLNGSNTNASTYQHGEYYVYNIGLGVITTTIGALLNKPRKQNTWDCIKKSVWQGAVGGALQYSGKKLTYQIMARNNYWWGLPSKLVHSAGVSICQNAVRGNEFGQYWVYDYGPVHANFHIKNGQFRFQPQFNVLFFYDVYHASYHDANINWSKSLKLGAVTFTANKKALEYKYGDTYSGLAFTRSMALATKSEANKYGIAAHELIHIMQADEFRILNYHLHPITRKIKSKTVSELAKYIYIEYPFLISLYALSNQFNGQNQFNFFEREVDSFCPRKEIWK
jgi:hypothetical protein